MMPTTRREKIKLIAAILMCQFAGGIGALFTTPNLKWYRALLKPSFNPPDWIFGPVWTILFLMMGVALFLVWRKAPMEKAETRAFGWFFIQLFLNVLWSFCFFGLRNPFLGFIEIVLLWLAIVMTIWMFLRSSRWAGVLLLPYWAWVSFAACLNFVLWRLNA